MGHHRPQKPGTDFQPGSHRLHRRRICRRTDLRGAEPLHLARRDTTEKARQPRRHICTPEDCEFAQRFNDRLAIESALKQAQADVQYAAAARAFDQGDMEECLEQFFRAIHSRYDIENPVPRRLIRNKLGIINPLKEQNAC